MLSDLQIALLVAGAAFLIGVFAFNKWQERNLRKRVDRAFGANQPDALFGARPPGEAPAASDAATADAPEAPASSSPAQPVEHTLGLPPMPEGSVPSPEAAETGGAGVLDARLDYLVTIDFDAPRMGEEILRTGGDMVRAPKPVNWEGSVRDPDDWRAIAPGATYRRVRAGLQLADRGGVASDAQIVEFCQAIQAFAATLVGVPEFAGRAQALRAAGELDALAQATDIQIGFNVVKPDGAMIPATKIRAVAEANGCLLDDAGRFRMTTPEGAELVSIVNLEPTPFLEDAIERTATRGVTLTLDVPRAPDGDAVFTQFADLAQAVARTLEGQLVDDNRNPISAASLASIAQAAAGARATLREAGVPAGGPLALRLFSP